MKWHCSGHLSLSSLSTKPSSYYTAWQSALVGEDKLWPVPDVYCRWSDSMVLLQKPKHSHVISSIFHYNSMGTKATDSRSSTWLAGGGVPHLRSHRGAPYIHIKSGQHSALKSISALMWRVCRIGLARPQPQQQKQEHEQPAVATAL